MWGPKRSSYATRSPPADADEDRLEQIFHNLVGNAVKFTDKGLVKVSASLDGERRVVRVDDTGIGIQEEQLDRIFQAFTQADASTQRGYGGTGLGLAVSRRLVELHGGRLWVESKPGEGSPFFFSLGVATAETAEVPGENRFEPPPRELSPLDSLQGTQVEPLGRTRAGEPDPGGLVTHRGCRILIVDDEPVNRQVLVNHLRTEGYELTPAANGPEALARTPSARRRTLDLRQFRRHGHRRRTWIRSSGSSSASKRIAAAAAWGWRWRGASSRPTAGESGPSPRVWVKARPSVSPCRLRRARAA